MKLLTISDFGVATGFARVMESIVDRLPKEYEIHSLAINYRGDPYESRAKLYPAMLGGDLFGYGRLRGLLDRIKPDIIFILQDSWVIMEYLSQMTEEELAKTVIYTPVDAGPYLKEWLVNFPKVKQVVAYLEYGKRVLQETNPALTDIKVIPHGVDTNKFFPVPLEVARSNFRSIPPTAWVVFNNNRNQTRKRIDIALQGFALFAKDVPEARYYHHAGIVDSGWNVLELAKRYGMAGKLILTSTKLSPTNYVSDDVLNMLYNAANVGINTSVGEGFGLCTVPTAMVNTPYGKRPIVDIKVGDTVYTKSGHTELVTQKYTREYTGDMVKIFLNGSTTRLFLTPEHPLFTQRGWIEAKDLTIKDMVFRPVLANVSNLKRIDLSHYGMFEAVSKDFVYFSNKQAGKPVATKKELDELRNILNRRVSKNDYRRLPRYLELNKETVSILASFLSNNQLKNALKKHPNLQALLTKYLELTSTKVPAELRDVLYNISLNPAIYAQIDRGLLIEACNELLNNSYYNKANQSISVSAIGKPKLECIQTILQRLGFPFSTYRIGEHITYRKEVHYINIPKSIFIGANIRNIFTHDIKTKCSRVVVQYPDLDGVYYRVNAVETVPYAGTVYNLEVGASHSYLIEGYAVHNCNAEHAATLRPQIIPNHSANSELYADNRGLFLGIDHYDTSPQNLTVGSVTSPTEVAAKLRFAYENPDAMQAIAQAGYNYFTQPQFNWDTVANCFREIFEQ